MCMQAKCFLFEANRPVHSRARACQTLNIYEYFRNVHTTTCQALSTLSKWGAQGGGTDK